MLSWTDKNKGDFSLGRGVEVGSLAGIAQRARVESSESRRARVEPEQRVCARCLKTTCCCCLCCCRCCRNTCYRHRGCCVGTMSVILLLAAAIMLGSPSMVCGLFGLVDSGAAVCTTFVFATGIACTITGFGSSVAFCMYKNRRRARILPDALLLDHGGGAERLSEAEMLAGIEVRQREEEGPEDGALALAALGGNMSSAARYLYMEDGESLIKSSEDLMREQQMLSKPVEILQNTFSDRNALHCTAIRPRILISAECSAVP